MADALSICHLRSFAFLVYLFAFACACSFLACLPPSVGCCCYLAPVLTFSLTILCALVFRSQSVNSGLWGTISQPSPISGFFACFCVFNVLSCPLLPVRSCSHRIPCKAKPCLTETLTKGIFVVFFKVRIGQIAKMGPRMHELQKSIAKQPCYSRYRVSSFILADYGT